MRRAWMPIAATLLVLAGQWFAFKDGQAFGVRDATDPVLDWHTPVYFGYYHLYLFGDAFPYLAAALFCVLVAFVVTGVWAINPREIRRNRRLQSGLCPGCGYNLAANTSGVCPECGSVIPPPAMRRPAPDRS